MLLKMEAAAAAAAAANMNEGEEEEEEEYELASSAVDEMPAGFRFHPTDSEIIIHYLLNKVINPRFRSVAIGEINLNKCEPWDLPQKARKKEEKEWFFFFEKEAKYPTGRRTNRATASGYWKATGKDREIYDKGKTGNNNIVGMKKTLVFYKGRAPKGDKTNWVIHEYRLHGDFSAYNLSTHAMEKWVVCKVLHKKNATDCVEISTPLPPCSSSLTRKPSSSSVTQETDQIRLNDNMFQEFQQHHQNNLLLPPRQINSYNDNQYYSTAPCSNHNYSTQMDQMIDSILPHESPSLAYYQDGLSSSMMEWYLTNFPIRRNDDDEPNSRIIAPGPDRVHIGGKEQERMCKTEAISVNNSVISPSQDTTGVSSSEMAAAAEINNCIKERESGVVVDEGLCFSPNISDMDSYGITDQ